MAKSLVKGEKIVIGKLNEGLNQLRMGVKFVNPMEPLLDIDIFAFVMDEKNCVNKEQIIFYNNPVMDKSINYDEDYGDEENKKTFIIDLNKLPQDIKKIVFGCSVYKGENIDDAQTLNLIFTAFEQITKMEMFQIHEEIDVASCETFLFGEIYLYKDLWKFNTVLYEHEKNILSVLKNLYGVKFY
ncbi:TerD family protein [Crassaminicella profunda]|uniref:TerD family protein n=1 Tax=Crassaminicella profunda TaxID=1286698 RepID=UPI001CA64310|nr:TerD family protein [Crassaminicella profunda]QZY55438.1 TerD family protein [Crassaminicella profunda]